MVSAAGSGELLFTPRIRAMYGYSLLWAMLAAIALKWAINREIGRGPTTAAMCGTDTHRLVTGRSQDVDVPFTVINRCLAAVFRAADKSRRIPRLESCTVNSYSSAISTA